MEEIITIVVPIYNVEKYLKRCLDSICSQTYKNLEIILVDDGSKDNSGKICDDYAKNDSRIIVIHKENGGVSSARNFGLDKASGKYISFVDSDDYMQNDMIEKMYNNIKQNDANICVANFSIEKDGKIKPCKENVINKFCMSQNLEHIFNRSRIEEKSKYYYVDKTFSCFLWRMMFDKDVIHDIRFNQNIRLMEDVLFFVTILLSKDVKISHLNEEVYFYQIRENSAMHIKKEIVDNHIVLYNELKKLLCAPQQRELLSHFEYSLFADCMLRKKIFNSKDDLSEILHWGSKENYKNSKKHTFGFLLKLRNFLIEHKLFWVLKILYKIKK